MRIFCRHFEANLPNLSIWAALCCSLLCSPDYHSADNAPQCINAAAFTLQSEYKEMDKTTIKSENLETYSFMLRKCKQSAWFLSSTLAFVQGGRGRRGTGRGSKTIWFRFPTVYRLSNFHARSQFTPNNVSKHSGAIFHCPPADFSGHQSQKIVTILTKEPLLICIAHVEQEKKPRKEWRSSRKLVQTTGTRCTNSRSR